MAKGIKLSNELYPATAEKILTQAEYIHDSRWNGNNKDQQSINEELQQSIQETSEDIYNYVDNSITNLSTNVNSRIDNLRGDKGIEVIDYSFTNTRSGQDSIRSKTFQLVDSIYNMYDSNKQYSESDCYVIRYNRARGDFNDDGEVTIADISALTDQLLNDENYGEDQELITTLVFKDTEDISSLIIGHTQDNTPIPILPSGVTGIKTFKIQYKEIKKESDNSNSVSVKLQSNQSSLERKITLINSINNYSKYKSSDTSSNRGIKFNIKILGYYTDNIVNSNNLVEYNNIKNYTDFECELLIDETTNEYEITLNVNNTSILVESITTKYSDILVDADRNWELTVADISALIDYLLFGKWDEDTESLVDYFLLNSYYNIVKLVKQGNNSLVEERIKVFPGLLYQIMDTDGIVKYFAARKNSEYDLYKISLNISNIDMYSLVDWFKIHPIITTDTTEEQSSEESSSELTGMGSSILKVSFDKYDDATIIDAYERDLIEYQSNFEPGEYGQNMFNLFNSQLIKHIELDNINSIVELPIYLWDLYDATIDSVNDTITYNNNFNNSSFTISIGNTEDSVQDSLSIVDNFGNNVENVNIDNINIKNPKLLLNIKFNNSNLSHYHVISEGNQQYYELINDVPLVIKQILPNGKVMRITRSMLINCKLQQL